MRSRDVNPSPNVIPPITLRNGRTLSALPLASSSRTRLKDGARRPVGAPRLLPLPVGDQYPEVYPPFGCVDWGAAVLGALVTALPLGDRTYHRAPNWFKPWPRVSPAFWSPT
jgi:hypothetical protein